MARPVTDKQREVLAAVQKFWEVRGVAPSLADLAADLREQVYRQIMAGRSDTEIRQYMRDRYGDFVLYDPPFAGHTMILWLGPIALLLIALATGGYMIIRRRQMLAAERNRNTGEGS